jgi:hypothetical protein
VTGPFDVQPHDTVTIELDPSEAAQGVVRTVPIGPAGRPAVLHIPSGLGHGAVVRLPGTDPSDPSAVREVLVRIVIRPIAPWPAVSPDPSGSVAAASPAGVPSPTGPSSATGPWSATDGVAVPGLPVAPSLASGLPASAAGPTAAGEVPGMFEAPVLLPPGASVSGYSAYGYPPPGYAPGPPSKPRRRWLWVSLISAVVLALLAAGAAVSVNLVRGVAGNRAAATSTPSPTAPPQLSTLDYQQLLTATDTELGTGFAALRRARKPAAVHSAANALSLSAQIAADRLMDATPPDNAQSVNSRLATDLSDFASMLSETAAAADQQEVCTAASAIVDVTAADATARLRNDIQTLAAATYTFGSFLPEPVKRTNRRAANGYLKRISNRGLGQLKIKNSGTMDTLVSVVPRSGSKAIGIAYVRGKGNFTVTGVRDGTYRIFVTSGVDWDASLRTFTRTCNFRKFDDTMKFSTTSTRFTVWTITLQATSGGNTPTSAVDPDQFPTG